MPHRVPVRLFQLPGSVWGPMPESPLGVGEVLR